MGEEDRKRKQRKYVTKMCHKKVPDKKKDIKKVQKNVQKKGFIKRWSWRKEKVP